MSPAQERNLANIVEFLSFKYRQGAAEHGDTLLSLTPAELLDEAIAECVDQLAYLVTAREKLTALPNSALPAR